MLDQRNAYLDGEGDRWFDRNAAHLQREGDVLFESIVATGKQYRSILEIGCSNGYRLEMLHKALGAKCAGVDPSSAAIEAGKADYPALDLHVSTADTLLFGDASFDLVIFGYCFCLIDPALHFRAVAEADRVLEDGGLLAIGDFMPPRPYHNTYAHKEGMKTYKMEVAAYFLGSPIYNLLHRQLKNPSTMIDSIDDRMGVDLLHKSIATAFPANPFA
ncbi:MAG: class I SAM-dependent methyltransferase [Pseudomonadota bacterium]